MRYYIDLIEQNLTEGKATVWGILYTPSKIILGKRSPSSNNPNQWNFFGGTVDAGESELQALVREIYEETSADVSSLNFKKVGHINGASYYAARLSAMPGFKKTKETSKIAKFSITDLPNNLHSKSAMFFNDIEQLLK